MSFSQVLFNKKLHTYKIGQKDLTAATKLVERYKQPFNRDEIAARVAKKEGRDIELVLLEWQQKATKGMVFGTKTHAHIAKILKNRLTIYDTPKHSDILNIAVFNKFWKEHESKYAVHAVEKVIGDVDLGVGGTVDTIFFNYARNCYEIWDWKTNTDFKLRNPYQNLRSPFDAYDQSDLNCYSMQLSLYRLIYQKAHPEMDFGDSFICHVGSSEYTIHLAIDFREIWYNELNELDDF